MASAFPFKKLLISFFVLFNSFTVLFMNSPPFLIGAARVILDGYQSPQMSSHGRYFAWLITSYAHLAGLDARWRMFGRQSRFNWWYAIMAEYADSTTLVLPLPRQSKRNFLEREFIDFKEAKFDLNIYRTSVGREAYARYLCRQYPAHRGFPIESIIYELDYQNILELKEARLRATHLDPNIGRRVLNVFHCPTVASPLRSEKRTDAVRRGLDKFLVSERISDRGP